MTALHRDFTLGIQNSHFRYKNDKIQNMIYNRNMKKKVIAYTHFHWDREWYKEYEKFRFRLLKSFDIVLEMLQSNHLPSFYFDGQTSALLDYLEIFPNKKDCIKSLVEQKKLFIGPFYCLVDEFLTSKEVFKKNLELGLKTANEFGCKDFLAYFADTFGHSACTIPILKEFGIDKAIVWRGCGDIPSEFTWHYKDNSIKTVNLVRGYFNDIFSTDLPFDKKLEFTKSNLDKIAEKSSDVILLPIGADHLAVPTDLSEQIKRINKHLSDYEIILGSPFDYFKAVEKNFDNFHQEGELRDNSKTFILEGCYSSRLDVKKYNILASHRLNLARKLVEYSNTLNQVQGDAVEKNDSIDPSLRESERRGNPDYTNLINYAYKLLIQNQAHDSICGCSTDDVHNENIIRYKKIIQISDSIINDFIHNAKTDDIRVLNLGNDYLGAVFFKSEKEYPFQITDIKKGFPADIFNDIYKIPITEDYTDVYTYTLNVKAKSGLSSLCINDDSDVFVSDNVLGNSNIFLTVKDNHVYIGNSRIQLIDFEDLGDSYNYGPNPDDKGRVAKFVGSKIAYANPTSSGLELKFLLEEFEEEITIFASLFSFDDKLRFDIKWNNTHKNHLLQLCIDTQNSIAKTLSEDLDEIIEREFNPNYNVRANLPKERGQEVMMNNAPMQRGVCANNIAIVTEGITQYEIFGSEIRLPLLRATGLISNPKNTARTTPAGPPIEVQDLQQLGDNNQRLWISFSNDLKQMINEIYNFCIVIN